MDGPYKTLRKEPMYAQQLYTNSPPTNPNIRTKNWEKKESVGTGVSEKKESGAVPSKGEINLSSEMVSGW